MSQGPLCPNLTKKVQKEVSQMANHNLSHVMLLGGLSVNLNHLKMAGSHEGMQAETEAEDAPRGKVRIFHCVIQTLLLINTRCHL